MIALLAAVALAAALAGVDAGSSGRVNRFPRFPRGGAYRNFEAPFVPGDLSPVKNFAFFGDAAVRTRPMNKLIKGEPVDHVQLTPARPSSSGLIVNEYRANGLDFDASVDIEIVKGARSAQNADGVAFWYLKDPPAEGPVYGIQSRFSGLGIVVDTYSNSQRHDHPYIYAWLNDGTVDWDDSVDGHGVQLTEGCVLDKISLETPTRISIQLDEGVLKVAYSIGHYFAWKVCFEAHNVKLPFTNGGVFAVSASTGSFYAEHFVSRVAIDVVGETPDSRLTPIPQRDFLGHRASSEYAARQAYDETRYARESKELDLEEEQAFVSTIENYSHEVNAELSALMDEFDAETQQRLLALRMSFARAFPQITKSGTMVAEANKVQRRLEDVMRDMGVISDELKDEYEALHQKVRQLSDTMRYIMTFSTHMLGKSRANKALVFTEYERAQSAAGLVVFAVLAQIACVIIFLLSKDGAAILGHFNDARSSRFV